MANKQDLFDAAITMMASQVEDTEDAVDFVKCMGAKIVTMLHGHPKFNNLVFHVEGKDGESIHGEMRLVTAEQAQELLSDKYDKQPMEKQDV